LPTYTERKTSNKKNYALLFLMRNSENGGYLVLANLRKAEAETRYHLDNTISIRE
jgi:hypothetical protein